MRPFDVCDAEVQEVGTRWTRIESPVEYIRVRRHDGQPMGYLELWAVVQDRYPGAWAIQVLPPPEELVDEANVYHVFLLYHAFLLDTKPVGLGIHG